MKVLSKSRYKLGLECPNKLYYTNKKEYANIKNEDSFLEALAQGGFQVEELARLHYSNGILIEGNDWDYNLLWKQTQELLKNENIVIYEAAFLNNGLFVRTDILIKQRNNIELVEVKSKSFDPENDTLFVGVRGGIKSDWKPYLFDVAFQKNVMQQCYPDWNIKSFIMMADKSKPASIDGLNQLFRITKKSNNRTGIIRKVDSLEEVGSSILGRKEITEIVKEIESNKHLYHDGLTFQDSISLFKELITFIETISHSKDGSAIKWSGERDMIDLWDIEKCYYYNPLTKGSNSLKEVLPASINSSNYLLKKYSKPISQIDVTSNNFSGNHIWLKRENEKIINPYKLLPPVFDNWTEEALENTLSEIEGIADGGAAMTAYSKMQYTDMTNEEIKEISSALLKYCELDTLAMVMVFEHFKELIDAH